MWGARRFSQNTSCLSETSEHEALSLFSIFCEGDMPKLREDVVRAFQVVRYEDHRLNSRNEPLLDQGYDRGYQQGYSNGLQRGIAYTIWAVVAVLALVGYMRS
jgi:hypothetical protein